MGLARVGVSIRVAETEMDGPSAATTGMM